MFLGEYTHTIDIKARLAVPVRFRGELAQGAVVTRGIDNCLFLYPKGEWQKLAEKLATLPISQANSRAFARLMFAGAAEVELDRQGRIVLPEYLKKFASLGKQVVVIGVYNRIEIWDEKGWRKYDSESEKGSSEIAEKMSELGV
ncbi:MAG: division/cell wall cluster transcriptional repressor MraZ [Parcubacteria group bacterium]|nr:division/cell wall cluster transcriptional repressor MraZ [Parcubacteria group bacterium]